MAKTLKNIITCVDPLSFPFKTPDPFLFCVYHKDQYPAGNERMEAPKVGNGADFNPSAPYRMYHGDKIPGFPQHPHRGFETLTATITGMIDHSDSMGNAGRYGGGDLQWMTAGRGVVHGEMFPLVNMDAPNPTRFFQIWLNLPAKSKMVEPAFVMHWAEEIPKYKDANQGFDITLWSGQLDGRVGLPPPPNSWASDPRNEVGVVLIGLAPGASYTVPAAITGSAINRMAYFIEGDVLEVNGQQVKGHSALTLNADTDAVFKNTHISSTTEVLILQGRPIAEPVAQHGPFVMNTDAEIQQAFADYRKTQFGGWPWPQDAMVFSRTKGRFSLASGVESRPPVVGNEETSYDQQLRSRK